jgi:hypothetical protein
VPWSNSEGSFGCQGGKCTWISTPKEILTLHMTSPPTPVTVTPRRPNSCGASAICAEQQQQQSRAAARRCDAMSYHCEAREGADAAAPHDGERERAKGEREREGKRGKRNTRSQSFFLSPVNRRGRAEKARVSLVLHRIQTGAEGRRGSKFTGRFSIRGYRRVLAYPNEP